MKHIKLLIVALLLLGGTATAQQAALQMNDRLSEVTDSLYARGQAWGRAFNTAYASKDFATLTPYSKEMLRFIDSKINWVKNLKDVSNSQALRMSLIELLRFEKKMVTTGFVPFESFTQNTSEATILAARKNLMESAKEEDVYLGKVAAEQEKYGAANGFKIAPAPADTAK